MTAERRLTMYEQDDRDTEKMLRGLDAVLERMKANGTSPKPSVSKAKRPIPANDN